MKAHRFSILGLLFISLSMVGLTATANTSDGETPAVETVCDTLKADGVTQGLYGLCLAFCSAQDIASEELPITEAELDALSPAPSGSILESYNKLRQATDPDMPCIVVDSTCPCWTDEELAAIDGIGPDYSINKTLCVTSTDPDTGLVDVATAIENNPSPRIRATAWDLQRTNNTIQRCTYSNNQVSRPIARDLDVRQGTLTPGQAAVCLEEVIGRCTMLGY